jgi:hypothetical protein
VKEGVPYAFRGENAGPDFHVSSALGSKLGPTVGFRILGMAKNNP